ncbi:MAG TPA: hypothetical protein VK137_00530 [Planctomycetaceae bacterium]|nr:hypothetical protein [Planctomycetaceae bacterium]
MPTFVEKLRELQTSPFIPTVPQRGTSSSLHNAIPVPSAIDVSPVAGECFRLRRIVAELKVLESETANPNHRERMNPSRVCQIRLKLQGCIDRLAAAGE